MKKLKGLKLGFKIAFHATLFIYGVMSVASPIMLGNRAAINNALGFQTSVSSGSGGKDNLYFNSKFTTIDEVTDASKAIIEETMEEGAVLLKNENNALPLAKGDAVNLYGFASYYSVYSGQGSGAQSATNPVTLEQGFTAAGLSVNQTLNTWYKNNGLNGVKATSNGGTFTGGGTQRTEFQVSDIKWSDLPEEKNDEAKAGIVVFARNSGEAVDLYMDTTMDTETMAGDGNRVIVSAYKDTESTSKGDCLALTENEKSVLAGMKALKDEGKLKSIIVIMNAAAPLMGEFVDDPEYGIDSCMWVGTLGTYGANAVGRLLVNDEGKNFSGRTADTFFANSKYNPVYYNAGIIEYGNSGILKGYLATLDSKHDNRYYVAYQEGIYNGYKYTETRYEDIVTGRENVGTFDYQKVVTYPFGYGLSYSKFVYSNQQVVYDDKTDTYTVTVDVLNDSSYDGKEVVQVYLQKPYTDRDIANGVEKASVELVGFDKIEVPHGETRTATIKVNGKYFAAYDSYVEKTYVVGSDNQNDKYLLTAAKDSHDAVNNILQYKKANGVSIDEEKIAVKAVRGSGDKDLVYSKYIAYDNKTYSTNEFIESENAAFENIAHYEGQQANYGVDKITNQFDSVDYSLAGLFSDAEAAQVYTTRSNWAGTCGKRIVLTATSALVEAQKSPAVETDDIPYPTTGKDGFYEGDEIFDEIKLIYLRGKDFNDPLWDTLLDKISWEEYCYFLQEGFRFTRNIESIAAPSTEQQNGGLAPLYRNMTHGQSGYKGLLYENKLPNKENVAQFVCNGIVAATYNVELIERLGDQTGEEGLWAGYNGIYGLGINIHRGAYNGRQFEYYSEDGFLTGMAAGYEAVGAHKRGMFVLAKHAILNDQETHRAGLNVWANEQSIREIYSRAIEVAVEVDKEYTPNSIFGIMTGMNRMGAKWTGGQGFCNTVLRAEYGMRGYVVSDYNSGRLYCNPIQGVLNGNDLPDGQPAGSDINKTDLDGNLLNFLNYGQDKGNYGKFAWAMRDATKKVLYTVVNSNAMNGFTGDTSVKEITPAWEIAVPVVTRVMLALFIWSAVGYAAFYALDLLLNSGAKRENKE